MCEGDRANMARSTVDAGRRQDIVTEGMLFEEVCCWKTDRLQYSLQSRERRYGTNKSANFPFSTLKDLFASERNRYFHDIRRTPLEK